MRQSALADEVRERRAGMGLTQDSLAEVSGLSRFTILRVENGHTENPGADTLSALAEALGCTVNDLLRAPKAKRASGARR